MTKRGLFGAWCPSLGATGFRLVNRSQYRNDGTLTNMASTAWVTSGGKIALEFDGVDDSIAASLITPATTQLTLSCWARLRSTGGQGTGFSRLFARANTSQFAFSYTNAGLAVAINGTTNSFAYTASSTTFEHFVATWDGATVRCFVNGTQIGSAAYSGTLAASTTAINLGGVGGLQRTVDGFADDWRLYLRALTSAEIRQLYIGGRGFGLFPERPRRRGTAAAAAAFKAFRARRQSQLIGGGL